MILEKSKELFFARGFNNVSIQDICDTIEYGRSAVYNIFTNKEEIYGYVYVEAMKILADLINSVDCTQIDVRSSLEVFTKEVFRFYDKYTSYYTALFYFDFNHVAITKIPAYLMEMKYKEKERAVSPVREVLKKGIAENILRDFNVDYVIDTYFASLLGIINLFISEHPNTDTGILQNTLMEHAKIYDRGLRV